ncbi:MAG: bacteriophage holin [Planctomycetota bacterium]|jgi:hypothetical protein
MKLDVLSFAVACAVVWGLGLFCVAWWLMIFDGATGEATLIGRVYRGYAISPLGSVIGLAWGLADGFIGGAVLAWLYNRLAARRAATT